MPDGSDRAARSVSRETERTPKASPRPPAPPPAARAVFGDRLAVAQNYVEWLAGPGIERGVLGPREVPRLWERHILNSAVVETVLAPGAALVDVGSGAGLPGLPLAIARPDLEVTLLEPLERRATFLREVVASLGLAGVDVVRSRAEDAPRDGWPVAVARAVAPLGRLVTWTLPLVRPGGRLVALKGRSAREELAAAETALRRAGAARWDVAEVGAGLVAPPTTIVTVWRGPGASTARRDEKETR